MPLIAALPNLSQQSAYILSIADSLEIGHDQIVILEDNFDVPQAVFDAYDADLAVVYTRDSATTGPAPLKGRRAGKVVGGPGQVITAGTTANLVFSDEIISSGDDYLSAGDVNGLTLELNGGDQLLIPVEFENRLFIATALVSITIDAADAAKVPVLVAGGYLAHGAAAAFTRNVGNDNTHMQARLNLVDAVPANESAGNTLTFKINAEMMTEDITVEEIRIDLFEL